MKRETFGESGRIIALIFVLLVSSVMSACNTQPQKAVESSVKPEAVTIGIATQVLSAPLIIAVAKGYFSDEGLNVTIKDYPFGKLALEALFAGEVNLATVAATPIVMNSFKRDDFSVIALFVYSYDESKCIVRKDRGITKPADLKGKKIGVPFGTSAQFYLDSYLNHNGYIWSDVKAVNFSAKELPSALQKGDVDAIVVFEPYGNEALKLLQEKAMRLQKAEIAREPFNLAGMKEFQANHPEALKKVLKALDKSVAFIQQNKAESISILVKKLNMDEKYLQESLGDYTFGLSLDQALLINFEDVAHWAMKNKLTDRTKMPNYLDFISSDALRSIKPEAVKIIR